MTSLVKGYARVRESLICIYYIEIMRANDPADMRSNNIQRCME